MTRLVVAVDARLAVSVATDRTVATVAPASAVAGVLPLGFVTVTSANRVPDGAEPDNAHVNWVMLSTVGVQITPALGASNKTAVL